MTLVAMPVHAAEQKHAKEERCAFMSKVIALIAYNKHTGLSFEDTAQVIDETQDDEKIRTLMKTLAHNVYEADTSSEKGKPKKQLEKETNAACLASDT